MGKGRGENKRSNTGEGETAQCHLMALAILTKKNGQKKAAHEGAARVGEVITLLDGMVALYFNPPYKLIIRGNRGVIRKGVCRLGKGAARQVQPHVHAVQPADHHAAAGHADADPKERRLGVGFLRDHAPISARRPPFRRCGCAWHPADQAQRPCHHRSCRYWQCGGSFPPPDPADQPQQRFPV